MSYDDDWPDMTWENRKVMVQKTIRTVTLDELKKLGEVRFPIVTDPWCVRYNDFLAAHPDADYFIAQSPEHAEVIYCRDSGKGVWFLPDKGMGVIQPNGLRLLAEITAKL
ncbi:MAG: hypothetical protein ABIS50_21215 [Luteolibacter sp.]|uniref:hypothetical protein n=1 Tax=Luteolibacter sp. TaxID=1962973 RepID=UPI0032635619